jgi:SPP1 gp7 family putative phage head morphogenesis protein
MTINAAKLRARLARNKRKVKGISANKPLEIEYRKTLLGIVRDIGAFNMRFIKGLGEIGTVKDSILTDYVSKFNSAFSNRFDQLADEYAGRWVGKASEAHKKAFVREIDSKIGINLSSLLARKQDRVVSVVKTRIKENSDLIKSLSGDFKEQAREAIHETLLEGNNTESLRAKLEHIEGVTESRAKLIARDQTQKVFSDLNQARQRDIGVKGYFWRGTNDGRERDTHIENNDKRFTWDNPPAETGHPGEDIQCRCTADPDLEDLLITINFEDV